MPQLSPYFASLAKQKRICPDCLKATLRLEPTPLDINTAVWVCDRCGWFQAVTAPKSAQVKPKAKVIPFRCPDTGGR